MNMVNMKTSSEEAKECCEPVGCDAPEYPYGLCIDLNDDSLDKLGITALPAVGTVVTIQAQAIVTATSSNSRQGGDQEMRASLQITDMAVTLDDGKSSAQRLYANSNMNP